MSDGTTVTVQWIKGYAYNFTPPNDGSTFDWECAFDDGSGAGVSVTESNVQGSLSKFRVHRYHATMTTQTTLAGTGTLYAVGPDGHGNWLASVTFGSIQIYDITLSQYVPVQQGQTATIYLSTGQVHVN